MRSPALIAYLTTIASAAFIGGASATPFTRTSQTVPDKIICNIPNFQKDFSMYLREGLNYLRKHQPPIASFGWQEGGGYCTRTSCEDGTAIYLCNDNEHNITVDLGLVADFAVDIWSTSACLDAKTGDKMATPSNNNNDNDGASKTEELAPRASNYSVQGQAFNYADGWNVILGLANGEDC